MVAQAKSDPQLVVLMSRFAESLMTMSDRDNISVDEAVKNWAALGEEFFSSFTELKISRAVHDLVQAAEAAEQGAGADSEPAQLVSLDFPRKAAAQGHRDREVRTLEMSKGILIALDERAATYVMPVATRR